MSTQSASRFESGIVLERLRHLLGEPWPQRAILVAVIVWVFWDGIFAGVARSDQILYLHHISQYDSLWDILTHSAALNRTVPTGGQDIILYRPVLYLLLGTFYYWFRYNFLAWQIAGLSLHIMVALGLHLLLVRGRLKHTLFPLAICALFATAFFGSEMVLWNHIVGYLLFCALDVYAVYFFLRFLQSDRTVFLIPCGALSVIAEFTYEAGALVNLLFAAALLARSFSAPLAGSSVAQSPRTADRWTALMFVLGALLLPLASLIDLRVRGIVLSLQSSGIGIWHIMLLACEDTLLQIAFWLSTWLAPTVYHCTGLNRTICGVSPVGLTALRLVNLIGLGLLAVGGTHALSRLRRGRALKREALLALTLSMIFLLGYSFIIAVGRSVGKGLMYVLQANIYYSYIAYLTVCVGIGCAAAVSRARGASMVGAGPDAAVGQASSWKAATSADVSTRLVPALAVLAIVNSCGVRELARAFRYDFAAPRQDVIDHVLAWRKQVGDRTERYFEVGPTCVGNDVLSWFDEPRLRRNSGWQPPVTLADALWPDRSAPLNAARVYISRRSVDEIRCDQGVVGH
jgi:hypothetical protein